MATGSLCHLLHPRDWRAEHRCDLGIKCGDCQVYETGLGHSDLIPKPNYPVPALADTETVLALNGPYYFSRVSSDHFAWDGIWRD